MRLTENEVNVVKSSIQEVFGLDADVTLFGSRTNDVAIHQVAHNQGIALVT